MWFIQGNTFESWKETTSLLWIYGKRKFSYCFYPVLVLTGLLDHSWCWQKRLYVCYPRFHFGPDSLFHRRSAIIEDLNGICGTGSAHIAFFFFDFKDVKKQDARALLSSLIVQLSDQSSSFYDILFGFFSSHRDGTQQPSVEKLTQCLENMLMAPRDVPIYVILDAIDECPDTSGIQSSRDQVLALVEKLLNLGFPKFHLCVTSRPEIDIKNVLGPLTLPANSICLHDQSGQRKDIADFVRAVVYSDKNMRRWRDEDKELVIQTLSERADGM